jgi:hypothetical protein
MATDDELWWRTNTQEIFEERVEEAGVQGALQGLESWPGCEYKSDSVCGGPWAYLMAMPVDPERWTLEELMSWRPWYLASVCEIHAPLDLGEGWFIALDKGSTRQAAGS